MLEPIYAAIEFALNHTISLDPNGRKLISRFHDKVIKLDISNPNLAIFILAQGETFQLLENFEGHINTTIQANLIDLVQLSLQTNDEKNLSIFKGRIKITGNIGLGQQFQSLFSKLDIDWEEHASHLTGDIIAHQLFSSGKKFLNWKKNSKQTLGLDISEFLQYETRDLLEKREVEHFLNQVDELCSATDRIEARIKRVETQLNNSWFRIISA
jgi:ubiquinone biosynthesis accessory factor UbiJ